MGVQAMKHAAMLQEWSEKIGACRSSGKSVKMWCSEQGISVKTYYYWEKRFVTEATQQLSLPAPTQAGLLMRVSPESMADGNAKAVESGVIIRHGETVIQFSVGSSMEAIADLVKALNRHA